MRLELFAIIAVLVVGSVAYGQPAQAPSTRPATTRATKGPMEAATELAGFFAAHAIWSVSDGETLIPLVGYETTDGTRQMNRMVSERVEEGAARGKEWLATSSPVVLATVHQVVLVKLSLGLRGIPGQHCSNRSSQGSIPAIEVYIDRLTLKEIDHLSTSPETLLREPCDVLRLHELARDG